MPLITTCGQTFGTFRDADELLTEQDLIGVWSLRESSVELLKRNGLECSSDHAHTLVLELDGTCQFESIYDGMQLVHLSSPATWKLVHDAKACSNVTRKNAIELDIERRLTCLNIDREDGQLILWQYHGDPDAWDFVEYVRAY